MAEQPMKVLVVSDVNGRVTPLRWLLKNETADALFFLGDGLYLSLIHIWSWSATCCTKSALIVTPHLGRSSTPFCMAPS